MFNAERVSVSSGRIQSGGEVAMSIRRQQRQLEPVPEQRLTRRHAGEVRVRREGAEEAEGFQVVERVGGEGEGGGGQQQRGAQCVAQPLQRPVRRQCGPRRALVLHRCRQSVVIRSFVSRSFGIKNGYSLDVLLCCR